MTEFGYNNRISVMLLSSFEPIPQEVHARFRDLMRADVACVRFPELQRKGNMNGLSVSAPRERTPCRAPSASTATPRRPRTVIGPVPQSQAHLHPPAPRAPCATAYLVLRGAVPVPGGLSAAVEYTGTAEDDAAGGDLSQAGDLDLDGLGDIVIGAQNATNASGERTGVAYVVLGTSAPASGGLSGAVQYGGERVGDAAGSSVSGAGDVNADGYGDLLIGAYSSDDSGSDAGAAYLVLSPGL